MNKASIREKSSRSSEFEGGAAEFRKAVQLTRLKIPQELPRCLVWLLPSHASFTLFVSLEDPLQILGSPELYE
jgi:hypothetical protein